MTEAADFLAGLDPDHLAVLDVAHDLERGQHVRVTLRDGRSYTLVVDEVSPSGHWIAVDGFPDGPAVLEAGGIRYLEPIGSDGRTSDQLLADLERDVDGFTLVAARAGTPLSLAIDEILEACAQVRADLAATGGRDAPPSIARVLAAGLNLSRVRMVDEFGGAPTAPLRGLPGE